MTGKRLTPEQIAEVRRLFPNHTKPEIRDLTGVGLTSIDRIQARYHLKKTPEHLHNMGVKAGKASSEARGGICFGVYTEEIISKRVATYKKTFREERARWIFGLPQKTRIRVRKQPHLKTNQRSYLRHLGYIIDEVNNIAYYTEDTRRATRMEAGKCKKCYFKFKQYEQPNKQEGHADLRD